MMLQLSRLGPACRWLPAPRWQSSARRSSLHRANSVRLLQSAVAPPGWQSSTGTEVVRVACGSVDPVCIFLHNMQKFFETDTSLFVYLPPYPTLNVDKPPIPELPQFLQDYPTVTIGYRWFPDFSGFRMAHTPLCWPTPIHDIGFAWQWIRENLCPEKPTHRKFHYRRGWDVNIVGAYRGAGLAVSLAVNASFNRPEFGIRKVMAYNGIYNWSMFLPDHRINRLSEATMYGDEFEALVAARQLGDEQLAIERRDLVGLFDDKPANLSDPFASPSLFFYREDVNLPHFFDERKEQNDKDVLRNLARKCRAPRRFSLIHPPIGSSLAIPEAHFFYTPLSVPLYIDGMCDSAGANCYEQQAKQLVRVMQRAIRKQNVEPMLWKFDEGTPEHHEISNLPMLKVKCDPLTDKEYSEISLVDESSQNVTQEDVRGVDDAIQTVI